MKKIFLFISVSLFITSLSFAGVNNQTGCGLGSVLIKNDDSAVMLALQATTNGTSGNQTFGITSGTSGCKKTKFVMNKRAEEFVAANMDTLAKEIAIGEGESIDTLAELLNVKDKELFAANLQANYLKIYKNENVKMNEVLDSIANM